MTKMAHNTCHNVVFKRLYGVSISKDFSELLHPRALKSVSADCTKGPVPLNRNWPFACPLLVGRALPC